MSPTPLPSATPSRAPGEVPLGSRAQAMSAVLARNWWAIALRGAFAVVFGLITFMVPIVSLASLVYVFAAYLLVDGVFAIVSALRAAQKHERWGLLVVEGLVDILAAVAVVLAPGAAIAFVVYLIALWSIVSGAVMTIAAFQLHLDHGRWFLAIAGVISIVFGILLAASPIAGAVVLTLWLGAYAFVFGIMLVILAFRLRQRHSTGGTA